MPFSESLAIRLREICARKKGIVEKKLFGGLGFLLHGHMLVGVWRESLVVRVGAESYEDARKEPFVKEFDITGKPMKGWVLVEPDGLEDDQLNEWIARATRFVKTLDPKSR